MGKGKKKGNKKESEEKPKTQEELSLSTLTVSEPAPSTSRETSAPPAEAPKSEAPKTETVEEEEEGGLGLGPYKKRNRPRKKKQGQPQGSGDASTTEPVPSAAPAHQAIPSAVPTQGAPPPCWGRGTPQVANQPPGIPQSEVQSQWSLPQSQPAGRGQPQWGQQQQGPPPFQRGHPQQQQGPPQRQPGQSQQQQGPPQRQPGQSQQQQGPPQRQPGQPQQQQGPSQRQPGQPQQQQGPPQRQPGQPQQQQGPPQRQPGQPQQQQGPPQKQQGPPPQQQGQLVVQKTSDTTSLFKIPHKIDNVRVPARPVQVITNYLEMKIQGLKIHRYDVSFKPEKPKKMIPVAFNESKKRHFASELIAFDQMKNCYSLKPLPKVPSNDRFVTNIEVKDNNGKEMKFEVSYKATGIVDLNTILLYMKNGGSSLNPPTEAIQAVDVILRKGTLENYVKAGRQFFKRPAKPIDLGDGLEMWTGLFQSAIFTSSAFVNVDVAHKGFPKCQPLIETMTKNFGLNLNGPIDQQRGRGVNVEGFKMFIKGLRVNAALAGDMNGQKREFICNEIVSPPSKLSFVMTDNGREAKISVYDYFTKIKKIRLRYPDLNCMWVGPRDKNIFYPMELLEVVYGQALNKQLNDMQLATMVREAATPPDQRKQKIEEVIRDMRYSTNPDFKKFGLDISDKFFQVQAKVLEPPNLDVGGGPPIRPNRGQWQARKLLKPEALTSWAIMSIEIDVNQCNGETIVNLIKSQGAELGMRVSEPAERFYNTSMKNLIDVLLRCLKKEIKFLVIIVPTRGRDYYHLVKQMAEREVGILTQCIKEYTAVRRMAPQTAKNILLKMNSKLMGINQVLNAKSVPRCIAEGGVMVVGADVTHPSPDQSSVPSIAAVTASIDKDCFQYNIQLSIQTPKKEMIVEFEDMMVEHLKVYKQRLGKLPRKIFVFRDGVSEGQFAQVMNSELLAVHKAYQRMSGNPSVKPEVLFLLVQKRHHTRLFQANQQYASYNVEPGTVVDTHIVHARELDFYLVSHQAIKGTARPTRYHAVCNDGGIAAQEVEQLTYYLCHLYSRCMRSVSYPTPTYYAHLACLRARSLTHGEKFDNQALEKNPRRLNVLDKMLEYSRMFFV